MKSFWLVTTGIAQMLFFATGPACAESLYRFTDLGTLGGIASKAFAINANGDITGNIDFGGGVTHPFFYSHGVSQDLGTLGGTVATGRAINSSGQIAGYSYKANGTLASFVYSGGTMEELSSLGGLVLFAHGINDVGDVTGYANGGSAFVYSNGAMHDIGTLSDSNPSTTHTYKLQSQAFAINLSGDIVGWSSYSSATSQYHAMLYSNGSMHDLGTLGGPYSAALGINASGQVVGRADIATTSGIIIPHAFLYSDGVMHDLGTLPGQQFSYAYGINSSGQVVGTSTSTTSTSSTNRAFVFSGGSMLDLNSLVTPVDGLLLNDALAINDVGQIVGGATINGQNHAFLLTPVPEPTTFVLGGMGIVGLSVVTLRRNFRRA